MKCTWRSSDCNWAIVSRLIIPRSATMRDRADAEPLPQPVHHRNQRLHVGNVARPQLAADRSPPAVENRGHHHLLAVRAMVLAMAVLAQLRPTFALEVDRRRVEEHQLQVTEQVPPTIEEGLLESVFGRSAGRRAWPRPADLPAADPPAMPWRDRPGATPRLRSPGWRTALSSSARTPGRCRR